MCDNFAPRARFPLESNRSTPPPTASPLFTLWTTPNRAPPVPENCTPTPPTTRIHHTNYTQRNLFCWYFLFGFLCYFESAHYQSELLRNTTKISPHNLKYLFFGFPSFFFVALLSLVLKNITLKKNAKFSPQKARLARIRIAKASSGAAFVSKKKAAEARLAAQESGIELDDAYREEDIFELQHHHLLRCLEKTTVGGARFIRK